MINKNHSTSYAIALFELAKETKSIEKYKKDAKIIYEVLNNEREILNFLNSKNHNQKEFEKIISESFQNINKNLINFLNIIILKNNAHIITKVLNKLINLINERLNIKEGFVYSLYKLSKKEITQIELYVTNILKLNQKIELINKIDHQLIFGIKIEIGDQIIEDTINSRLGQLRNQLLERKK